MQKLPLITDTIQLLIDDNIAQFIITGSSARKIKNLLPGRVIKYSLSPLMLSEIYDQDLDLKMILENGTLPEIFSIQSQDELEIAGEYVPIEVKWAKHPSTKDIRHLINFMAEYNVKQAYLVCRCDLPQMLADNVLALPWNRLPEILDKIP